MRVRSRYGSGTTGPIDRLRPFYSRPSAALKNVFRTPRKETVSRRTHARHDQNWLPFQRGRRGAPDIMAHENWSKYYIWLPTCLTAYKSVCLIRLIEQLLGCKNSEWLVGHRRAKQSAGTNLRLGLLSLDYSCSIKRQGKHAP